MINDGLSLEHEATIAAFGIALPKLLAHLMKKRESFEELLPHLPKRCSSFLDIGCGHGGFAVHLARHYETAICNLLDGDELNNAAQVSGWNEHTPTPWRTSRLAAALVRAYWTGEIRAFGPDPSLTIPCDLIVSQFSWGHHYPIAVYLPLVLRSLAPQGVVIVDIRKNSSGQRQLAPYFQDVQVIARRTKLDRLRCEGLRPARQESALSSFPKPEPHWRFVAPAGMRLKDRVRLYDAQRQHFQRVQAERQRQLFLQKQKAQRHIG